MANSGEDRKIEAFLAAPAFAVAGASEDPSKYGHLCFHALLANGRKAYALNPRTPKILGQQSYANLAALPEQVQSLSVITPPAVTEKIVDEAIAAGVRSVWMQPGAESAAAVKKAEAAGLEVIHGGACLLVVLALRAGQRK